MFWVHLTTLVSPILGPRYKKRVNSSKTSLLAFTPCFKPIIEFRFRPPTQPKSHLSEGKLFRPRHFGDSIGEPTKAKSSLCLLGCRIAGKKGLKTPTLQQHKAITVQLHKENMLTNMRLTKRVLTTDSLSSWRRYKECNKLSSNLLNL